MVSPGTAFLLAYLPSRRLAHAERLALVERNAATVDPQLKHAIDFLRQGLKIEESMAAEADAKLANLALKAGIALPAVPPPSGLAAWSTALREAVHPFLTSSVLEAAWTAGETGRVVAVSVAVAAHLAYLRCAAPQNPDLRAQAQERARELKESAARLKTQLEATGLPLMMTHAGNVAEMVRLTRDLEPTTTGGYRQLNELVRDLNNFLDANARHLDVAPPTKAAAPPTTEEEALYKRILAAPDDRKLRLELAALAERRNDPRAQLIRLQLEGGDPRKIIEIVQSHPEWIAPLEKLGARNVKLAGGFPGEITVDAAVLLQRGSELLAVAPLTRVHVRAAKDRVGEVVRSPLLATLEALDLDDQGVTDDDLVALAASPHAAGLRQLDLRYNPISARGIEALAASRFLKHLEVVNLDGNPDDPVDRVEYYDETNTHVVPTDAGKKLESKYGPLRWLRRS